MAGSNVALYSTTGATNKAVIGTIDWRENVYTPDKINDNVCTSLAHVRGMLNDLAGGWVEYGDGDGPAYTPTYVSATVFRIDGVDVSTIYTVGRRVRMVAATPGTIYGTITAVTFSTNTSITVAWDTSVQLSNEAITSVMISVISDRNEIWPGMLVGLTLSNGTDATNDIDIAAGMASAGTNYSLMSLATGITKQLDAAWAVGTNAGGLDTGSIANAIYAMWLIKRPDTGVVDALYSTSFSAPTMPTNYTLKRRIGAIIRTGAAIKAFTQIGDYFRWSASVADISATNPGTSAVTRTITAPPSTEADLLIGLTENTGSGFLYISPLSATDEAATSARSQVAVETIAGAASMTAACRCFVDGSSQLRSRVGGLSDANTVAAISTIGYWDRRGRDT